MCYSQLPGVAFKGMYRLTFRVAVNKLLDSNDLSGMCLFWLTGL